MTDRRLNVLLLVHPDFHPQHARKPTTEKDVFLALRRLGHRVDVLALDDSIDPLLEAVRQLRPSIVFNLLEEFRGEAVFDFHVVSVLEALGVPFTGCNPRGLAITRNKQVLADLTARFGVRAPQSWLNLKDVRFPAIVKFAREHASLGISESNVVRNLAQLKARKKTMRRLMKAELVVQEFIPGREVTVSVLGRKPLPPWELHLGGSNKIATMNVKFSPTFRRKHRIVARPYSGSQTDFLKRVSKRMMDGLELSGYARFDFRIREDSQVFLIDVNANPSLLKTEDFAQSARREGIDYDDVINQILLSGMRYRARR